MNIKDLHKINLIFLIICFLMLVINPTISITLVRAISVLVLTKFLLDLIK